MGCGVTELLWPTQLKPPWKSVCVDGPRWCKVVQEPAFPFPVGGIAIEFTGKGVLGWAHEKEEQEKKEASCESLSQAKPGVWVWF